uniref:Mitochondrial transcription termination factor n=1 Tax=Kalanchoe fedtschenkoi TaxID=63787 RepID=A0A7N0UWJ8_KALFE
MLAFIAKKLFRSSVDKAALTRVQKPSKTTLKLKAFVSSVAIQSTTPLQSDPKVDDFTASYLIHSCGLQIDAARRVSSNFQLQSVDQPDQALNFFKRCGFTDYEISTIVRRQPTLLLADADVILQPQFELLASLGAPLSNVLRLIHDCPGILNVENLDAVLDTLKRLTRRGEEVLNVLARFDGLSLSMMSNLAPNVAFLRDIRMPDSSVFDFLMENGNVLLTVPERFKEMADRVLEMGFDPKESSFVEAICTFAGVDGETWELRVERFKKWGWSDKECDMAFRTEPRLMLVSDKKIDRAMDYLVTYMGVKPSVVAGCLNILEYNLDKRIIPLCPVREFVDALSDTPDRLRDKYDRALTKMFKTEKQHSGGSSKPFDAISVEAWERKVDSFKKRWGWSHREFLMAFRNHPRMMLVSQKKIDGIMEFLVNKMGVDASVVAEHPNILKYSLERRITPRCSVIELLMSQGVVERKDHNIYYVLRISEETFVEAFVKKYQKILPKLMDFYSQKQLTGDAVIHRLG